MRTIAYWLAIAFVFTVPWENAIHVGEIGRVSKTLGLVTAGVWAVSVLARGRLRRPDAFQKAYFLFLIWNGLTIYWSIDAGTSMRGFLTYTEIFGMLLMVWDLFDSEVAIRTGLQAYVLGALISSGSIIVEFWTTPTERFAAHQRFQALGFETDGIALILAIAAPAAWYLAAGPRVHGRGPGAMRIVNYAYIPIALFALVLTGTRGATLASIPTAVFVLWSLRRATAAKRIMAWGALGAAVVMVVGFAPAGPLDRIGTAVTVTEVDSGGALSGRWGIWMESREVFLDRPIIGVGLDAHRAAIPTGKEAHNTYVSVLVETGLVGFVLFARVLVSLFARVRRRSGWEAWYWFTQVAVVAIGAMSLSLEDSKSVWIVFSLALASAAAAQTRGGLVDARHTTPRAPRARELGRSTGELGEEGSSAYGH